MKYLLLISVILFGFSSSPDQTQAPVVVIGGGLMGSATAWQLVNQGRNVLLFEQQDSLYTYGSSYGEARIARSNNRGNDIWSYLHNCSVREVEKLISFLNEEDSLAFSMEDIYTSTPVSYVGRTSIYEKLHASLIRQKVDYKMATTPQEGRELFDVNLPEDVLLQIEYNQYSGMINPQALIKALHEGIIRKGGTILYNHKVTSVAEYDGLYEVAAENTKTGENIFLKNKYLLSAAGPYTGNLLENVAPYYQDLINPQRVFLAFLRIQPETYHSFTEVQKTKLLKAYPVINSSTGTRDGSFFSMIEYFDEEGAPVIKIGGHFQRSDIENLDEVWKQKLSEEEITWSKNGTKRYMDLLELPVAIEQMELVDQYSCVYSLTETEVPIVSYRIDEEGIIDSNFVSLAGLSGVGAKGAMAYGMMAANLINKQTIVDSMYQVTMDAMGVERLQSDIKKLDSKK